MDVGKWLGLRSGRLSMFVAVLGTVFILLGVGVAGAEVQRLSNGRTIGVTPTNSPQATTPSTTLGEAQPPLVYHNGPLMLHPKTYLIFWDPSGHTFPSGYESTVARYLQDMADESPKLTDDHSLMSQYADGSSNHISTSIAYGGAVDDTTTPYPAAVAGSQCAGRTNPCLTDSQIRTEITTEIAAHTANGWTNDATGTPVGNYILVTPANVEECQQDSGGACTFSASGGFCGYHSDYSPVSGFTDVYSYISYNPGGCSTVTGGSLQAPTGAGASDINAQLNTTTHEVMEATTDPYLSGYFDTNNPGLEIGDKCAPPYANSASQFGNPLGGWQHTPAVGTFTGTLYNQVINGRQYFEQTMWSNAAAQTPSGGGSGCAQRLGPTPVFTGAPSSATTTTSPMTLQGGSSYDINSTITNYDWGWGDGSADTTGAATSASHTYSTPGTYPATLTTTDSSGATNATTQTADVVVRDPAHQVKISEFRPQGGGGPFGGFVELYNPTASPVSLTGWKVLDYDQSGIGPSVVATLGAATIAGNGHYLIGFASYPTSGLPNADFSNASAVISYPDALAVVNATGTLQDSVRLNSQPNTFLASGGPVLPIWEGNSLSYFTYQTSTNNFYGGEYGYARYLHTGNGGALGHSGTPQDTNANSTDFALVVPEAQVGSLAAGSWVDGSPEPHNAASQTVIDSSVQVGLLSGTTDSAAPNQEVDAVSASPAAARTMYIRRTLTNQTGGDITRLQFQVSDITTAQKPDVSSQAILRVLSDPNTSLSYNGTTYPLTPMTLDAPANQDADGGGLNSTLTVPSTGTGSISPTTPWHNGTSIDVEFKIGVARGGTFNFYFNTNDDVVYPRGHGSHGPGTPPGRGGNSGSGGHLNGH